MAAWTINRESVSWDCLEGEVVAIHLGTGIYYSLRGTAATVWQVLAAPVAAPAIVAAVTAVHAAGAEAAGPAVGLFLERLRDEQLIVETAVAGEAPAAPAAPLQPYAPPVLERFSDLQDLLLLDPIHDVGAQGWPHRPPPDRQ